MTNTHSFPLANGSTLTCLKSEFPGPVQFFADQSLLLHAPSVREGYVGVEALFVSSSDKDGAFFRDGDCERMMAGSFKQDGCADTDFGTNGHLHSSDALELFSTAVRRSQAFARGLLNVDAEGNEHWAKLWPAKA